MDSTGQRRSFHTLDGLRGIPALLVVSRHVGPLAARVSFPESFLAADLFFLLSGFVVANAYDDRLAQPGFLARFLIFRLIRLYPLYLLGLLLGATYRTWSILNGADGWTEQRLIEALLLGLLMVPKSPLTTLGSSELDGPTWTLLPELVANVAYACCFRWMSRTVLACIVASGAASVIACRVHYGTLDAGWEFDQWPVITACLLFSFFGGVLLFRLVGDQRQIRPWVAWFCVLVTALTLCVAPPERLRAAYEIATVLIVFPLVVWVSCRSEPAASGSRLFRFLGVISYAVYVLHQPLSILFTKLMVRGGVQIERLATPALFAFGACLVVGAWLTHEYFDARVRRWLNRRCRDRHVSAPRPLRVTDVVSWPVGRLLHWR